MIHITSTIDLDERDITERFVRATGSRGQNMNKATTPGPSAREERLASKHRHSAISRSRRGRDEGE